MHHRTCDQCQAPFVPPRKDSRFCSKRCGAKASRDRNKRTCEVKDCSRPYAAKGMCYSHYGAWHRAEFGREDVRYEVTCIVCGATHMATRPTGKYCSTSCKGQHYSETMRRKTKLPADHPVMVLIAEARKPKPRKPKLSSYEWRTARECPGCACLFTPLYTPNAITCSRRCSRRVHRWRRKAAERNATGTFTWSEFMRIARRFDYTCAYCGERDGQLESDHVVPLSRGGSNSTTNLLPSCRSCNADKSANLLHEWAESRERRDLPPRITSWSSEDRRYWHLVHTQSVAA